MNCEEALDMLQLCESGEADEALRQAVEAHLSACPSCQREAAALRKTLELYRHNRLSTIPPASVRQAVVAQAGRARHGVRMPVLVSAAAGLLLASMLFLGVETPRVRVPVSAPSLDLIDSPGALSGVAGDLDVIEKLMAANEAGESQDVDYAAALEGALSDAAAAVDKYTLAEE